MSDLAVGNCSSAVAKCRFPSSRVTVFRMLFRSPRSRLVGNFAGSVRPCSDRPIDGEKPTSQD